MNRNPTSESESDAAPADTHRARERDRAAPGRFSLGKALRTAVAGVLMGVANLIPGVSGGTMILAMGLYEEFIDSVAQISAFRFSLRRILFLGIVAGCAGGAIVGLAGLILYLLFHYTSAMFALFIGLTLGGAPLLARGLRPVRVDVVIATVVGFGLMVSVFLLKSDRTLPHNMAMDFVSGIVASTTMVLPGISGSYMLLVMDQYDRIVGAVDDLKTAAVARDLQLAKQALWIVIPVGIAAVVGIAGLSNVLKVLLRRYHRATVGVLFGILLGSVLGLYPFGRAPGEKSLVRRSSEELRVFADEWRIPGVERVAADDLAAFLLENWNRRQAPTYSAAAVLSVVFLAIGGFAVTFLLARSQAPT
ncbi:MAG: DUF368 domain-containing protein [Planctomycetes bacterium]|nr:DUF368 domain-containing protein [Planctomycetota bacterium]